MGEMVSVKTERYVGSFNLWKRKTAKSFIEMGKVVVTAKENLTKDQFDEFVKLIGCSTAASYISKLYQIGLNSDVFEANVDQLPSSYTTLYQLTTVNPSTLNSLFEQRLISPSLKGRELNELVNRQKRYRKHRPDRQAGPVEYIEIDEPLERMQPIELRIDETFQIEKLPQVLRQLELLARHEGINLQIPTIIFKKLEKLEVQAV